MWNSFVDFRIKPSSDRTAYARAYFEKGKARWITAWLTIFRGTHFQSQSRGQRNDGVYSNTGNLFLFWKFEKLPRSVWWAERLVVRRSWLASTKCVCLPQQVWRFQRSSHTVAQTRGLSKLLLQFTKTTGLVHHLARQKRVNRKEACRTDFEVQRQHG